MCDAGHLVLAAHRKDPKGELELAERVKRKSSMQEEEGHLHSLLPPASWQEKGRWNPQRHSESGRLQRPPRRNASVDRAQDAVCCDS